MMQGKYLTVDELSKIAQPLFNRFKTRPPVATNAETRQSSFPEPNPSTTSQIQKLTAQYVHLSALNQLVPADVTVTFPADPSLPKQQDAQ